MSDLKKNLLIATGLTFDIDNIDVDNMTDIEKTEFINNLSWHIPGGENMRIGRRAEAGSELLKEVHELLFGHELDSSEEDVNHDSNIDDTDTKIKSQIEIESKEEDQASDDDKEDPESNNVDEGQDVDETEEDKSNTIE